MKYRSISLNGDDHYSLVKYNDDNFINFKTNYEAELEKIDKELANKVREWPENYNEARKNQSYMITQGVECIGAISIEITNDGKDLEVEVQLNEEHFSSEQKMIELIDQLIESLKIFFFDKENIKINLINDIDLLRLNYQYIRNRNSKRLNTYICSNKENNKIIPEMIIEMYLTEKCLTEWGQSWVQRIGNNKLYSVVDAKFIDEINKGTVTLPELFSKVETILWNDIKSTRSSRNIIFSRDGNIDFSKTSNDFHNGINYEFSYNILSEGFNLKHYKNGRNNRNTALEIVENQQFTNIKTKQLNELQLKANNRKSINYTSPVVDNSSIAIELWKNDQNEIENCYVDFRTHKNNGKINGMYILRLIPHFKEFSIRFISRKGNREYDFGDEIIEKEEELFCSIVNGNLTIELIDELIRKVIPIINRKAKGNKRQSISDENANIAMCLVDAEREAISFIKQIKGEIPLPHLQDNLEKFIMEHDKSKKDNKSKVLK